MKSIELVDILKVYASTTMQNLALLKYKQKRLDTLSIDDYIERSINQCGVWYWLKENQSSHDFAKIRILAAMQNYVILAIPSIPKNILTADTDNCWTIDYIQHV